MTLATNMDRTIKIDRFFIVSYLLLEIWLGNSPAPIIIAIMQCNATKNYLKIS